MVSDMLTFAPNDTEKMILDRHNIRWSEFCHTKIKELDMEVDIVKDMDSKIINRALLIIMGCLIFALSPLLNDVFLVMLEYIVGTSMVFIGSISMVFLLKKYRKNKKITNEDKIDGRRIL